MKYGGQTGYKYLMNLNLRHASSVVFGLIALAILSAMTFGLWTIPSVGLWLLAATCAVAVCLANGADGLIQKMNLRHAVMVVGGLIALAVLSAVTYGLWTLPSVGLWLLATIAAVAVCLVNGAYGLIPGIFVLGVLLPVIAQLLAALTPALPFLVLAAPFVWLWGVSSGELGPSPRPRKKDW